MGKRKRSNNVKNTSDGNKKPFAIPSPPQDDVATADSKNPFAIISPEELEVTIDTLQTLSSHPSVIKSKLCKHLRAAVYDFRQACTTGANVAGNITSTARVSAALADGKYTDALVILSEIRIRGETPKLGALCRWVRDLDVVSGLSMEREGVSKVASKRSDQELLLLKVLDAILRATGPIDTNVDDFHQSSDPIALQKAWDMQPAGKTPLQTWARVQDGGIFVDHPSSIKDCFSILETTPGPERKPPNLHPAVLYTSQDDTILLKEAPQTSCNKHPSVPNLRLIQNVLSPSECTSIIAAAESVEFIPDAPIRDQGQETSILAHNFYWMVDQSFHDKLWARVKEFVPEQSRGRRVRGINRRFRVYRYVPGAEYRCHIDGAWPPSGIDPTSGNYKYDASPPNARQSSLYTFLIYLNDEFEGGETTFFIPSQREGILNAYPVVPVMGSVAVFPHGEDHGALLHEGTGVTKGAKYVIRTDVEYDVDAEL